MEEVIEQPKTQEEPDFGLEFNNQVSNLVNEYGKKLPINLIVKILNNIATDALLQGTLSFAKTMFEPKNEKSKLLL